MLQSVETLKTGHIYIYKLLVAKRFLNIRGFVNLVLLSFKLQPGTKSIDGITVMTGK